MTLDTQLWRGKGPSVSNFDGAKAPVFPTLPKSFLPKLHRENV